jgi:hypothetical protein
MLLSSLNKQVTFQVSAACSFIRHSIQDTNGRGKTHQGIWSFKFQVRLPPGWGGGWYARLEQRYAHPIPVLALSPLALPLRTRSPKSSCNPVAGGGEYGGRRRVGRWGAFLLLQVVHKVPMRENRTPWRGENQVRELVRSQPRSAGAWHLPVIASPRTPSTVGPSAYSKGHRLEFFGWLVSRPRGPSLLQAG